MPRQLKTVLAWTVLAVAIIVLAIAIVPVKQVPIRPPECPHPEDQEPAPVMRSPYPVGKVFKAPLMAWSICSDHS